MKTNIPYAKDENLPTLEEIISGFQKIDSLNIGEIEYNEVKKIFQNNLKLLPQFIAPDGQLPTVLYRTSCINESELDITNIQTFSYPPIQYCSKGRCNLKAFPVFYSSFSEDTALRERRKENNQQLTQGDEVYISHWKINEGAKINYSQFIFGKNNELGDLVKNINQINRDHIKEIIKPYTKNKQEAFEYLVDKLSAYFISENYNISSFLAHNILYDGRDNSPIKADVLIYPSIQAGLNSINLAIHPDFVRNHIKLIEVKKVRFDKFEENGTKLHLIKTGHPNEQNKIDWFSNVVNIDNMKVSTIEVSFEHEPTSESFIDEDDFYLNNHKTPLHDIVWQYINENIKDVVEILFQINSIIDYQKIYQKEIFFSVNNKSTYLKVNSQIYYIETIKILLDYKIIKQIEN